MPKKFGSGSRHPGVVTPGNTRGGVISAAHWSQQGDACSSPLDESAKGRISKQLSCMGIVASSKVWAKDRRIVNQEHLDVVYAIKSGRGHKFADFVVQ